MSYQVFARKWRPGTFDEVVGQHHIIQTLKNAITIDRIAHAYLFAGTRGVGKTSTARILARAINCQEGKGANPCNHCESCLEILGARSLDFVEIDGASNNSVDDVRELRESVKYAPAKTRYKVYLIDEVHMLSKPAFNALLKTLEEPPAHLVFIFATTELHKVPETVLSRCQYFEFKQINSVDIVKQLEVIAGSEGVEISSKGLKYLARAAEGSLRDAESLLDQAISYAGKRVSEEEITSFLGMTGTGVVKDFVDRIIEHDTEGLLSLYQEVVRKGRDIRMFCRELQEYFRNLAVARVAKDPGKLMDLREEEVSLLKEQARGIDVEAIQFLFNTLLKIEYDLKNSPAPFLVLEMALVRMSRYQPTRLLEDILKSLSGLDLGKIPEKTLHPSVSRDAGGKKTGPDEARSPGAEKGRTPLGQGRDKWEWIQGRILGEKPSLSYLLGKSELTGLDDKKICIGIGEKMALERLKSPENLAAIRGIIEKIFDAPMEVQLDYVHKKGPDPEIQKDRVAQKRIKKVSREGVEPGDLSNPKIIQDALDIFNGSIVS